jgi:predicted secreted protein
MAGTEMGKDWRIQIGDDSDPVVYSPIGGETTFDWKRSSQEIDLSSKDDGIYGSTTYGQQKITFSVSGNLKLPDVGLLAAEAASKASPPQAPIKVVKGAIVKFAGVVAIGNFSVTAGKDGAVTYTFDASNVGAPDTDDIGAAGV